jgi:hypothetical protein
MIFGVNRDYFLKQNLPLEADTFFRWGRKIIILLEGSQATPACPVRNNVKVKTL